MTINYFRESEKYRPKKIEKLLVGEAPPSSGKTYFYVPKLMSENISIRKDRSLPTTIFYHYFQTRPTTVDKYIDLLLLLKKKGIFLVDICDDPIKVRGNPEGKQRIIDEIPNLRKKLISRKIKTADEEILFLLARTSYSNHIRTEFPNSKLKRWIDFRMNPKPCINNSD
jgi:hypothetical protein